MIQNIHSSGGKRSKNLTKNTVCCLSQNWGGLHIPEDSVCQLVIYCYVMFHDVINHSCRNSLCEILKTISNLYDSNIKKTYLARLANILFNNYCYVYSPKSLQEPPQKVLKFTTN